MIIISLTFIIIFVLLYIFWYSYHAQISVRENRVKRLETELDEHLARYAEASTQQTIEWLRLSKHRYLVESEQFARRLLDVDVESFIEEILSDRYEIPNRGTEMMMGEFRAMVTLRTHHGYNRSRKVLTIDTPVSYITCQVVHSKVDGEVSFFHPSRN